MKTLEIFTLFLVLCCLSCQKGPENKTAFDSAKWQIKYELDYPYRDQMVANLMAGDTLKQLSKIQILELLGQPDRSDGLYLFYQISQERLKSWPLHTKTLVLKLSSETGPVEKVMIHE